MPNLTARQIEAMLCITAHIARARPEVQPFGVYALVESLARTARSLHRRYEAACSYEWANTEAYERRTERLETYAAKRAQGVAGVTVEHQRDPRGWPLIVKLDGVELGRLG